MAVLIAGVGLGVGAAALLDRQESTTRYVVPSAHARPVQSSHKPLGPASAGVQPGREDAYTTGEGVNLGQAKTDAQGSAVSPLDSGASASFKRFVDGLPGAVDLAVEPVGVGMSQTLGGDEAAHGWSTTKVPVLSALLAVRGGLGLDAEERSWAESAITESNNESILHLFAALERVEGGLVGASSDIQEILRKSGDQETVVATAPPPAGAVTTFGQTRWKPSNAVKFFGALARGCLISREATSYVIGLMQHIESSESWGLGSAGFARVAFKGGWGPEQTGAYLVRQSGIVDVGSSRAVAVAMVAFPSPGASSFEVGTAMLTRTATWLRAHLRLVPRPTVPCN